MMEKAEFDAAAPAILEQLEVVRFLKSEVHRLRQEVAAYQHEIKTKEQQFGNVLARIHGDGGHYIDQHGWEKACQDAEAEVCMLVQENEDLKDSYRPSLTFHTLSTVNRLRCEDVFHRVGDWSETDWACALAGEVGELCNLIKKRRRGDTVTVGYIGAEMADVMIYLDLLATRLGVNLEEQVVRKFNLVSEMWESSLRLRITGDAAVS